MSGQPDHDHLIEQWSETATRPVVGWDFTELRASMTEETPPWDYRGIVRDVVRGARSALDLGTGGGEFLLSVADALPGDTVATEAWQPNIAVAAAALEPHGIPVVGIDAERDRMPFPDERFDVVLSRHEAYDPAEVARLLMRGGTLLTQQVGGDDLPEIHDLFGEPPAYPHVRLDRFRADAEENGLEVVDARQWRGTVQFADVDTFVRFLAYLPWNLPTDYSVERYRHVLLDLHERGPAAGEPIAVTQSRFVLRARRR